MQFKRALYIVLLSASLSVLGGCMKVTVDHSIQADGSSHVVITNDLSALAGLGDLNDSSFGSLEDAAGDTGTADELDNFEENLNSACDDFYKDTALQNANCVRDGYVVTMEGDSVLAEPQFTVKKSIPYITYSYDAKHVIDLLGETGGEQSKQFNAEALAQAKAGATLVGMTVNYSVNMPGKEVVTANVGKIEETTVEMNVFDVLGADNTTIQSRSLNWLWLSVLIIGLLVLLGVVIVVGIIMMKRKSGPKVGTTPGLDTTTKPFEVKDEKK